MTEAAPDVETADDEFEEVPWAEATLEERLGQLGNLVVARDIEDSIRKVMDRVRQARLVYKEPRNIVVFGETGVGKSDIMARYLGDNGDSRGEDGNVRRPVLLVEVRNAATPASVAKQMLSALGVDEEFHNVSTTELSRMLKQQMIGQGVELAILDEFHNTLTDNGAIRANRIADWVKDLSKTKRRTSANPHGTSKEIIPFVMVGTRKVKGLIDPADHAELRSITPHVIEIDRYRYGSTEEKKAFVDFLNGLDEQLPFDRDSHLGTVFGDKLHMATFGLLRQVGQIVTYAAELALHDGSACIQEHHLHLSVRDQEAILQSNLISEDGTKEERDRVVTNPFAPPRLAPDTAPAARRGFKRR